MDATDLCDPELDVRLVDVVSSQPDNGKGDGNTVNDAVYSEDAACVRSERRGKGKRGRFYTVTVEVTDDSGNAAQGSGVMEVAATRAFEANLNMPTGELLMQNPTITPMNMELVEAAINISFSASADVRTYFARWLGRLDRRNHC